MYNYNLMEKEMKDALTELLQIANLKEDILVIGCSTSEVIGKRIGQSSDVKIAKSLMSEILPLIKKHNLFLAIQCCEHLNRALVVERKCAEKYDLDTVSVLPHSKAGSPMGEVAMEVFANPVVVESIKSKAKVGMDIGDTLIGMHLKRVAVPVRLSVKEIGKAHVTSAHARPPLIGGARAKYK